jgi:predicted kinase
LARRRGQGGRRTGVEPYLVVVSGPPGSGTTTLAHALARALPCPAICRDELKEGLAHGAAEYSPVPGDALAYRTLEVFFGCVRFLVESGVTLVAEASFQHRLWEPGLRPLLDSARVRIVHCRVEPAVAHERIRRRAHDQPARRAVHGDPSLEDPFETFRQAFESFDPVRLGVPTIEVDTTDGYDPPVEEVVAFVKRP